MKFIATTLPCLILAAGLSILVSGCNEADQSGNRRARLVGSENLQLKKQVKSLNEETKTQKGLLAECEKEKAAIKKLADDAAISMLTMSLNTNKKNEALTKENEQLKAQIEKLKGDPIQSE